MYLQNMKIAAIQQAYPIGDFSKGYNKSNTSVNSCRNESFVSIPTGKISYIYFTGAHSIARTPYLKSTLETIDKLYSKYEKSLMETKKEDLIQIYKELRKETNCKPEQILEGMSEVTQFSGIESVVKIGDVLKSII